MTSNPVTDPDKVVGLELTPAGPIDLPLGQMVRLQAYANLEDGRRVQVPSERLTWKSDEKAVPGLELYNDAEVVGAVGATKVGAGPLNVYALYHDKKAKSDDKSGDLESNRVAIKGVEADPNVKLAIDVDRTVRIAGEGGQAVLTGSTPSGDVELIPSLATFTSANDKVLKFNDKKVAGKFGTGTPGRSVVTGSHIAAKDSAKLEFQVCDPSKVKLVFDPPAVTLPINQTAPLRLMLEGQLVDGGKTDTLRAELVGPNVSYSISQPTAVRYSPPLLAGVQATNGPFDIVGAMFGVPPATAKVTVTDAAAKALRITATSPSPLAPWQTVSLKVEQQTEGDTWDEVRPDAVKWDDAPNSVTWTAATESLRPTITLPPDLQGEAHLKATLGNLSASISLALKPNGPDIAGAQLVLDREPGGSYLPVGQSQRYSVLVAKDGHSEPAIDVHWPSNFENDYVKWEAPVLTAKSAGYTQFLRADVGGRNVLWHTTTYRPGEIPSAEPVERQKPDWIKIFSQQGPQEVQSVRFPVGATFSDFKVEVHYPDGFTRFVTKKAFLKTPESAASALVTAEHGKLIGLRTGKTQVSAEFQNVVSKEPLEVEVLADVDIDRIAIEPANPTLRPGESYDLHAIGYKNGQSVGDITGLGNLTWTSADPNVARIAGNSVIASSVGSTQVTVDRKGLKGTAQVTVSTHA